jgi:hypothetical protein
MDALLTVSSNQAITTTAVSTDKIDLQASRDIGGGERLFMLFTVTAALTGGTSLAMEVVTDDNSALSSPKVIGSSGAIPAASLTLGAQFAVALQPVTGLGERYLGANYTVVGTFAAGTVTAGIVRDVPTNVGKYYPSGYTIA